MTALLNLRTRSADEGFTLLELVVVLAIAAGIAALSLPNVWRKPAGLALRATALDMASMMRAARSDAVRSNNERGFLVNPAQRIYWSDANTAQRPIPHSLAIDATFSALEPSSAGSGRYTFFADGTASGGKIVLREGNQAATIFIDGLTGNAEVQWTR